MKILTLVTVYLPGYKSGGPLRTIASLVDQLGDDFDFWILTGDRDLNDDGPYPDVLLDQWVSVGKARVYYSNLRNLSLSGLSRLVDDVQPDVVYLNSFFSTLDNKYLLARRIGMIPRIPTIVAPRGVFSPGAFQIRSTKKRLYMQTVQRGGLFKGMLWQASSPMEKKDILVKADGVAESDICIASDLAGSGIKNGVDETHGRYPTKESGHVRFIFLSRISPIKNLTFALTLLGSLAGRIDFDIVGPIEDANYWNECKQIIAGLPDNVTVHVHGAIPHEEVGHTFRDAHFFFFPTLGENFGHVIIEALQEACPVLVSDQTPWNDLNEAHAGWVIPLEDERQWLDALQTCVDMDQAEFANYSGKAMQYAVRQLSSPDAVQANRNLFLTAVRNLEK